MDGSCYLATANDQNAQRMDFQMVQRLGYIDSDNTPDDLFAFAGIKGIKIDGQVFAPNLSIGSFEEDDGNSSLFGIFMGWKSDNSAHSYMANINGYLDNLIIDSSYSNLPKDIWDFTYGYGY